MSEIITAVDSSALFCIANREAGFERWIELLGIASAEGALIVCPVVFAEFSPSFSSPESLLDWLRAYGISYSKIDAEAAHLAGQIFNQYRKAGGPRVHLIPDFLIAAHAQVQANRLAAIDRGYLRRWFPELSLLTLVAA